MKSNDKLVLPVSAAAFLVCSVAAGTGLFGPFDVWMLDLAQGYPTWIMDGVGLLTSVVGGVEFVAVAAVVLAVGLIFSGRRGLALRLLVAFVVTGLVEFVFKMVVPQEPVPDEVSRGPDPSVLDVSTPYPYPSGHMLRVVLLLGALYVLWPSKAGRGAIVVFLIASAASRVYLGTHWPSDVIGGALLGVAGLAWVFRREQLSKP